METQAALRELKKLFRGQWSWEHGGFGEVFTEPNPQKALKMAEDAVRAASSVRGRTPFQDTELSECLLVYCLLIQAVERGDGTVGIEQKNLEWLRLRPAGLDYAVAIAEFRWRFLPNHAARLPNGVAPDSV